LIDERRRAGKQDTFYFLNVAKDLDLPTVDVIESNVPLTMELIQKYSTGITTLNGKPFEGVVINHGVYDLAQGARSYTNAAGEEIQVEPFVKTFMAGSFKVINKNYDSKK
jgi:hypothetical protein